MKLSDLFGKKNVSQELGKQSPFQILTEFVPYKLYADRKSSVTLSVKLKNLTTDEKEVRIGELATNLEKESRVEIYGGPGVEKGEYTMSITAFAHYRDYAHVLNAVSKKTSIEVV
ncbi:MAG: hypothetical protein KGH71_06580 [Candidatus Micrarchaeota archaeon]|nr:hypothetical protein [Candidatus Micrarchaeota archaeon]